MSANSPRNELLSTATYDRKSKTEDSLSDTTEETTTETVRRQPSYPFNPTEVTETSWEDGSAIRQLANQFDLLKMYIRTEPEKVKTGINAILAHIDRYRDQRNQYKALYEKLEARYLVKKGQLSDAQQTVEVAKKELATLQQQGDCVNELVDQPEMEWEDGTALERYFDHTELVEQTAKGRPELIAKGIHGMGNQLVQLHVNLQSAREENETLRQKASKPSMTGLRAEERSRLIKTERNPAVETLASSRPDHRRVKIPDPDPYTRERPNFPSATTHKHWTGERFGKAYWEQILHSPEIDHRGAR
jgi:chromosome segregation ATPase